MAKDLLMTPEATVAFGTMRLLVRKATTRVKDNMVIDSVVCVLNNVLCFVFNVHVMCRISL